MNADVLWPPKSRHRSVFERHISDGSQDKGWVLKRIEVSQKNLQHKLLALTVSALVVCVAIFCVSGVLIDQEWLVWKCDDCSALTSKKCLRFDAVRHNRSTMHISLATGAPHLLWRCEGVPSFGLRDGRSMSAGLGNGRQSTSSSSTACMRHSSHRHEHQDVGKVARL